MKKVILYLSIILGISGIAIAASSRTEPTGPVNLMPGSMYVCSSYSNGSCSAWVPLKSTAGVINTDAGTLYEPKITAGANNTYWAGNKTFQILPQASPGGNTTQLQYNNNGTFSGTPELVYISSSNGVSGRLIPRTTYIVSEATPTFNTSACDDVSITALATNITNMTANMTGSPVNFQKLLFRIKDNGTAFNITWGSGFEPKGVDLPTITVANKTLTNGFIYDNTTSKWGCVAAVTEQ